MRNQPTIDSWIAHESVVEFMRFENIDENPEVEDIEISFLAQNEKALRVGFPGCPELSVVQEPSIVKLPDNRLFCVMRTSAGSPYYSVSKDDGENWSEPEVLRYSDNAAKISHPLSPCPLFHFYDDKYIFFYHNHNGNFGPYGTTDTLKHRRPVYASLAMFVPGAKQPLAFSDPVFFADNGGVGLGPSKRNDFALYSSFTLRNDSWVLWYPDRKYFLLGKKIPANYFENIGFPVSS